MLKTDERLKDAAKEIRHLANLANDSNHNWTDEDESKWNAANKRYDSLKAELETRDTRNIGLEDRIGWDGLGDDPNQRKLAEPSEFLRDARSGRKVPVFRSNDSMADYLAKDDTEARERYDGLQVGDVLRALATGCHTDAERRTLSEGTDSAGGYTVPTILSAKLVDLMRKKARVFQSGAATIPLDSDQHSFAKLLSDPTPAWRAELDSVGTGDPTFGQVVFAPKGLAVLVRMSEELLQDSVNAGAALQSSIANAMALEVDRAALFGSGSSNQPTGLFNMSSVNEVSMGTNGAAITDYTPVLDAVEDLQEANAGEVSAAIMAPRTLRVINGFTDSTGQPLMRPPSIADIPFRETTQVPVDQTHGTETDASTILLGDFSELVLGFRQQIRIEVLKERYRDTLEIGFLAHLRMDVQAWHEESFAKITGITP